MAHFCDVKAFPLDSFFKTSKDLGIENWACVGPAEYLNLSGQVIRLNTSDSIMKPKWQEWALEMGLHLPEPPLDRSPHNPPKLVVIAPGSGSRLKNWPTENFLQIMDHLIKKGSRVKVVFGPVEQEQGLSKEWELKAPQWQESFIYSNDFAGLLSIFSEEVFWLGCDSGLGHLAALCGCYGLIIFQNSEPRIWSPWSGRFTSLGSKCSPPQVSDVLSRLP
jgi:ADP-heptose:LPS heptosyltransferase